MNLHDMTPVDLTSAAEDHFLHGHFLSAWVVDYIDLEQSLAIGSVAQEELAHASTFLALAGLDDADRDKFVYERPVDAWRPSRLLGQRLHDFPAAVIRGLLLAHAAVLRAESMRLSNTPDRGSTGVILAAEQQLHVTHWAQWARLLSRDPRTADEFRQRATTILPLGRDLFGVPSPATQHAEWSDLHAELVARMGKELDEIVDVGSLLGPGPCERCPGVDQPELVEVLGRIRELRLGPDDGVRGLYR